MSGRRKNESDKLSLTSRRAFCTNVALTSAGLVLATASLSKVAAAQEPVVAYPPRKIDGAETLLPGRTLYFNYPTRNDPAVLLRSSEGEYRAYSRRCSHAGCSVDVDPSNTCLKCPCHQGTYDARMGYAIFGPPRRPLDTIVMQMRAGGQLWAVGIGLRSNEEVITQAKKRGDGNEKQHSTTWN